MQIQKRKNKLHIKQVINNALLLILMFWLSMGAFSLNASVKTSAITKSLVNMTCASSEFELGDVVETDTTVYRCAVLVIAEHL